MVASRFKQEITGIIDTMVANRNNKENNHFWQRHAEEEVARYRKDYENGDLIVDNEGVARWKSNGSALMEDCVEKAIYARVPLNEEATKRAREREVTETIEAYRKANINRKYTEEELYEMRAAFGEGASVVDILTGRTITL